MSNAPESRGLRLTLRTLLAWMDDTLPPVDVRQIGQQVSETPVAKELANRIQRVTRKRRLTVPSSIGPDATDANLVASYLDNELPADEVAEYEKRCLNSDVHLAEVASCHQILSMIGQKAQVPTAARQRMYRLVRGREAVARKSPAAHVTPPGDGSSPTVTVWSDGAPPSRSLIEKVGLPLGVLSLAVIMLLSAWMLSPTARELGGPPVSIARVEPKARPEAAPVVKVVPPEPVPQVEAPAAAIENPVEPPPPVEPAKPAELAPGSLGRIQPGDGIVLRWGAESRSWSRALMDEPLRPDDRLVCLAPFRGAVHLGGTRIELIGPAEVRALVPLATEAGRLDLVQGSVVIHGATPPEAITVVLDGKPLVVTPPSEGRLGVSRDERLTPGDAAPTVRVSLAEGEASVKAGVSTESLTGPGVIVFSAPDKLAPAQQEAPPSWLSSDAPPAIDQVNGKVFAAHFKPEIKPSRALVEAIEDDQEPVRGYAVLALGTLGELDLVIPALSRPGDGPLRRATIATLRSHAERGGEAGKLLHDQLARFGGEDWAATAEKLLKGFTADEARQEATYTQLVKLLADNDVGIRELAIEQLTTLTHRDPLRYDPDKVETGPGLKNWQDLLRNGEIVPRAPAEPRKTSR